MADAVSIVRNGHRTFFKWHRAQRRPGDLWFSGARIREGMRLGASVEVDLVITGDQGFAVLHEAMLGIETTGSGPVSAARAADLRALRLRDNSGRETAEPIMLLEDLAALAEGPLHPEAMLQLDYKLDAAALSPRAIANFVAAVAPVAPHMILSSGDAEAVRMLTDATPGVRVGYDPCDGAVLQRLAETRDFAGFVAQAVDASPRAEMIYLAFPLVLGAADAGFDIVAAFHARGRRIDAYTVQLADDPGVAVVERLLGLKVDQITTDDADGLAARLG